MTWFMNKSVLMDNWSHNAIEAKWRTTVMSIGLHIQWYIFWNNVDNDCGNDWMSGLILWLQVGKWLRFLNAHYEYEQ